MDTTQTGRHISQRFDAELEVIRAKVLAMGALVRQQFETAMRAYQKSDRGLAEQVIRLEPQVDGYEIAIDKLCTEILALRQPEAVDLRLLISVIKTIAEMERIGDYAEEIAGMALQSGSAEKRAKSHFEVRHLYKLVRHTLDDALAAFETLNVDNLPADTGREEKIGREFAMIIRQLGAQMLENPEDIAHALSVLSIVRALERIGRHAINIVANNIFMVKGIDIRHTSHRTVNGKTDA